MLTATFGILAVAVLAAFATEATAGFGSTIISLAIGSQLYEIRELVPVLVPLNVMVTSYIVIRHRRFVQWRFLLARILPLMVAGAAGGLLLSSRPEGPTLARIFGGMVVVLALRELWSLARPPAPDAPTRDLPAVAQGAIIGAAGVVHGIYATGGPLLVYALGRSQLAKSAFRATLASVWLCLNIGLVTAFAISGRFDTLAAKRVGLLIPVVLVALAVGEWLHHRVRERPFRALVFSLLLLAGAGILVK